MMSVPTPTFAFTSTTAPGFTPASGAFADVFSNLDDPNDGCFNFDETPNFGFTPRADDARLGFAAMGAPVHAGTAAVTAPPQKGTMPKLEPIAVDSGRAGTPLAVPQPAAQWAKLSCPKIGCQHVACDLQGHISHLMEHQLEESGPIP